MSKWIENPIKSVELTLKDIAEGEGDLTRRISISGKDETGTMAEYFNLFVEKLQSSIQNLEANTAIISSAVTDLTHISKETMKDSENSTQQANILSTAAEEVNNNIHTVATAMEEMSASIKEIALNSNQAAEIATSAVQIAKKNGQYYR